MKLDVRTLACGLAGCAVVLVTACGSSASSEPTPSDLQASMRSAVSSANSVHFDGQLTSNGVPVGVDMGVNRAGALSGTITQNGARLQVLGVNAKVYIKATPEFLKQVGAPSSACSVVCGRWIQLPPQQASQITSQLSLRNLTGAVNSAQLPKFTESGSTTVNGQPAWVMRSANGASVDVSQASPHFPLQAHAGGGQNDVITFSQWNSVPHPTAPPANQVISLNGLQK
jgi:hypothetical protein